MPVLISIIIPVYKTEKYLHYCIDSIIRQTYTDLEIILVNDGSTDNCGKICDEYAEKDTRIKVIHKPNGGVSSARNAGIDIAAGEYVAFIDSDDWVTDDYIEYLYTLLHDNKADVSVVKCLHVKKSTDLNGITCISGRGYTLLDRSEALKRCVLREYALCALLNRSLIGTTRFINGCTLSEDYIFFLEILKKVNKMALSESMRYYYRAFAGSATNNINESRLKSSEFFIDYLQHLKLELPFLKKYADARIVANYTYIIKAYAFESNSRLIYKKYIGFLRKNLINTLKYDNTNIYGKVFDLAICIDLNLYIILLKMKRKKQQIDVFD